MEENYDFRKFIKKELFERFPTDSIGYEQWSSVTNSRNAGVELLSLLNELKRIGVEQRIKPENECPRVFVSHRQSDTQFALRIAQLAKEKGFKYWLDVLDPMLQSLPSGSFTPEQVSMLTAAIIEMGLINATHVIAVISPNTKGTMWVPYEYSRITDIPTHFGRAYAWIHRDIKRGKTAEYLLLGNTCRNKKEIEDWL